MSRSFTPLLSVSTAVTTVLLTAVTLAAQELPLKRTAPEAGVRCPAPSGMAEPGAEEREQAGRLASNAAQAVILGDRERARDLLARAAQLDPSSADIAYQYGRILQELGNRREAIAELCRVVALAPDGDNVGDARARLDELAAQDGPPLGPEALAAFAAGVRAFDAGRYEDAVADFGRAAAAAPQWADAFYDRAVSFGRLGRREQALADLRTYLSLTPDAPDAVRVSQRIGQLQSQGTVASPGTALTLGLVLPGMGQFYSGRALGGLTVLSLVGGAAAAGYFIEEVEVRCLVNVPPGEECPAGQVLDERVERPYMTHGLVAAGAIMVFGAVEAFVKARGRRGGGGDVMSVRVGDVLVDGPALARGGRGVGLRLLRLRF